MLLALGVSASACALGPDDGDVSSCEGQPIPGDRSEGFEVCSDDTVNKVGPASCSVPGAGTCTGTEQDLACTTDADCTEFPNGVCNSFPEGFDGLSRCGCQYFCSSDDDCDDDRTCVCESPNGALEYGICVQADCQSNDDCASGQCGISAWNDGCGVETRAGCRSPDDQCRSSQDCGDVEQCAYSPDEGWRCVTAGCAIGRPLIDPDGSWRSAALCRRDDWLAPVERLAPDPDAAAYWVEVAALEHASVASFARFTLQLMALGAPADLVADTQRASADEVEHARLAYGLASALADEELGPGPLTLDTMALDTDPLTVLKGLIEEACINETLGAIEARFAADACDVPQIAGVLRRIAEDELRHAQLAWRSLQWLMAEHPELRDAATTIYARCAAQAQTRANAPAPHPYLSATELGELHRSALREVIAPAFRTALPGRSDRHRELNAG